jgi:hypothetical protein
MVDLLPIAGYQSDLSDVLLEGFSAAGFGAMADLHAC